MEDFEMHDSDVVMGDQIAMSETAAQRAQVLQQNLTVGSHEKNLIIVDPQSGKERMADVNDAADMQLVQLQEEHGREAMLARARELGGEKRPDPKCQKNVLFGRGLRKPADPKVLGFDGELRGIWPPSPVNMLDYMKKREALLQAEGIQTMVMSYVTSIGQVPVLIRGYGRPYSATTLEIYATLFGFMKILSEGQAIPHDEDLDAMFAKLESKDGCDRLLLTAFESRAQHMTLPQLELLAHRMFSFKTQMEQQIRDNGKASESATKQYTDVLREISTHVYSSLLWYNRPIDAESGIGAPEFSKEQLMQLNEETFKVLKTSELGKKAIAEGRALPHSDSEDDPLVMIKIRTYSTPEWFRGGWNVAMNLLGVNEATGGLNLPSELPVWCDETVLVSVLVRAVMFYYHYHRGMESAYVTNHLLPQFYDAVARDGAKAITPAEVQRLTKEMAKYTQSTLRLQELCVILMLAQVFDVQDVDKTRKIANLYEMIGTHVDEFPVVVGFAEGQENCLESPNFHLNPATVNSALVEQTVACKNAVDMMRKDPKIGPHVDAIIKLMNEPSFKTAAWKCSPIYVVFSLLSYHYMNQGFVNKDAEVKRQIEIFFNGCHEDITPHVESVKLCKALEERKAQAEKQRQEESEQQSKNKRRADEELETPTDLDDEDEAVDVEGATGAEMQE